MWTVPGAEAEKVFGWAELIGGYVIQLSKVGGVVASLPHCRSSADTMYTTRPRGVEQAAAPRRGWPRGGPSFRRLYTGTRPRPWLNPSLGSLCEFELKYSSASVNVKTVSVGSRLEKDPSPILV